MRGIPRVLLAGARTLRTLACRSCSDRPTIESLRADSFCSLYQKDAAGKRTAAEQQLFDIGLKGTPCISELYSHMKTYILKVTALPAGYPEGYDFSIPDGTEGTPNLASYTDRGWCFCESSMGNLVKDWRLVLDLAKFTGTKERRHPNGKMYPMDLSGVSQECRVGRSPPLAPSRFRARLEHKSFTSKKADLEAVGSLYEGAFEQRMAEAEELNYGHLGWTDEDAMVLSEALAAATSLRVLSLRNNSIGDEGVKALAAALREGGAPKLEEIEFRKNSIEDEGVKAMAAALREGKAAPNLKTINFVFNPASEAAKAELGAAREGLKVRG